MAHSNTGFQSGGYKGSQFVEPMKTIGAQDLLKDDDYITHVGWLYKRDSTGRYESVNRGLRGMAAKIPILKSRWKNCYMIIHKGSFYIYQNDSSKKPRNCFSLLGYSRVMRAFDTAAPDSKSFAFKLIHVSPEERTWYFATGSDREMQLWMAVIKSEMEKFSHGEVTGQTQKLVMGLKRPSLTLSHDFSLEDDDAIYNALEMGVKYEDEDLASHNYSPLGDSAEEEDDSSDEYEEPWEDSSSGNRRSVIDRPLPPPPGSEIDSRPPAPLPSTLQQPVTPATRAPMPLPGKGPSPSPQPRKPQGVLQPGGFQPPKLRPWEKDTPPIPSQPNDKLSSPSSQAPKLRPWEQKNTPPIPTPRNEEKSSPPVGGVKMMQGLLDIQLRKVNQPPGTGRSEPNEQSAKVVANEKETSNSTLNRKVPLIPHSKPALPNPRPKPPPPVKKPEPLMLPPSANIDSSDKAMTDQYLNAYADAGMYLVRKSREPGTQVIVVYDGPKRSCLHYKVFSNADDGTIYLQQEHPGFSTMEELLKYYTTRSLPTTRQKLCKPFPGPK